MEVYTAPGPDGNSGPGETTYLSEAELECRYGSGGWKSPRRSVTLLRDE